MTYHFVNNPQTLGGDRVNSPTDYPSITQQLSENVILTTVDDLIYLFCINKYKVLLMCDLS